MERLELIEAMRAAIPLLNRYSDKPAIFNIVLTTEYRMIRINYASTVYGAKFVSNELPLQKFLKFLLKTLQKHEYEDKDVQKYFKKYKPLIKEKLMKGEIAL